MKISKAKQASKLRRLAIEIDAAYVAWIRQPPTVNVYGTGLYRDLERLKAKYPPRIIRDRHVTITTHRPKREKVEWVRL